MHKPLYLLIAKSGAGKDYITDIICEDFGIQRVNSRTTRKQRNAQDRHIFVSEEQADAEFDRAIAKTIFHGHRYYVLEEDLDGKDIYIIDPQGVESLKNNNIEFISIYIDAPWYIRAWQMKKRGDSIKNIFGRLWHDRKAYKGFEADITVRSSQDVYTLFTKVEGWDMKVCSVN